MKVIGVVRMFDNKKSVLIALDKRPTDEELRKLFDALQGIFKNDADSSNRQ